MSSENKNLRKELKSPDKFQVSVANGIAWSRENRTVLIAFAALVVLALVGTSVWTSLQNDRAVERQAALGAIDAIYDAEEQAAEKLREPLRTQLDEIAASPLPNQDGKSKAATTKQDNIVAKIRAIKADHSQSMKQYAKFAETYQDFPEGWIAALRTASDKIDRKDLDGAGALLKSVLQKSQGNTFFQIQAGLSYVVVLEEKKEIKSALTEVEKLLAMVNNKARAGLLLIKGRLQYANNETDEANKTLNVILEKHAGTIEADKARTWRAILPSLEHSSKL